MRQPTICADNLLLLGEMVEMASGYIKLCQESLCKEEAEMVALAYSEIPLLRKQVAELDSNLRSLRMQLRNQSKQGAAGTQTKGAAG